MNYDNWKTTDTTDNEGTRTEEEVEETPFEPYIRTAGTFLSGSCLRLHLDNVRIAQMTATFGQRDEDGYWDEDGGYDGMEWCFTDEDAEIYKVYFRWGRARIGAYHSMSDTKVAAFAAWLNKKVG